MEIEAICFELKFHKLSYLIVCVYRAPSFNFNVLLNYIDDLIMDYPLDKVVATDKSLPVSRVRKRINGDQRIVLYAMKSSTNGLISIDGLLKG